MDDMLSEHVRIIETLNRLLEFRDEYTKGHSKRVADNSVRLFDALGLVDIGDRYKLYLGSFLHDIGKVGMPDSILKSSAVFNKGSVECNSLAAHPQMGFEICLWFADEIMLDIILSHHEKLDGSGYPRGLTGKDITLLARIVAICDIYDSLRHERSYRKIAFTHEEALSILEEEALDGKLDMDVYRTFKKMFIKETLLAETL